MSGHCALQAPLHSARRVRAGNYLVKVRADTALPVLAEVYESLLIVLMRVRLRDDVRRLTVVLDLLIVLDRLY